MRTFKIYSLRNLKICNTVLLTMGFPGGSDGKESASSARDLGSIPGLGWSPGGGHGNPLQYSCLENAHGQRNLAGYSPCGLQRVGHDWATKHIQTHHSWKIINVNQVSKSDFNFNFSYVFRNEEVLSQLGCSITYLSNTNKSHALTMTEALLSAGLNNLLAVFFNLC